MPLFIHWGAGALALVPQEQHILEALQLLAERNGEPQPDGTYATDWPDRPGAHFLPWGHPLVHLEEGIRYGCKWVCRGPTGMYCLNACGWRC